MTNASLQKILKVGNHKNSYVFLILCFIISIFITGCGSSGGGSNGLGSLTVQNPVTATNSNLAKLSGIVIYNNKPVANALVQLYPTKYAEQIAIEKLISSKTTGNVLCSLETQNLVFSTKSDSNGYYCFENVPVGEYTLIAMLDAMHQFVMPNVVLPTITTVNAEITPTGKIVGKITLPPTSGTGSTPTLAGAIVYLQGTSYISITDSDGKFEISNVPANATFTLKVTYGRYYLASNIAVAVAPGQVLNLPTYELTEIPIENGIISGTVVKANSNMHDGVIVVLRGLSYNSYLVVVTGISGEYSFPGLKTGEYLLQFVAEGYETVATTAKILSTNQNVNISQITLQNHYKVFGAVEGQISFPPSIQPEQIKLLLINTQTYSFYQTYTGFDGKFRFNNVMPSRTDSYVLLVATETGYRFATNLSPFTVIPNQTFTFTAQLQVEMVKPYITTINYNESSATISIDGLNFKQETKLKLGTQELLPINYSANNLVYDLKNVIPGTYTIVLKNPDGFIAEGPIIFVPVGKIINLNHDAKPTEIILEWQLDKFADRYAVSVSDNFATETYQTRNTFFSVKYFQGKRIEPKKNYRITLTPLFGEIIGKSEIISVTTPSSVNNYEVTTVNLNSSSYEFSNAHVDEYGNIVLNTVNMSTNYLHYIVNDTVVDTLSLSDYLRYDMLKNYIYLNNGSELQKFEIVPTNPTVFMFTPYKKEIYDRLFVKCDRQSNRVIVLDWHNSSVYVDRIRIFDENLNELKSITPDQLPKEILGAYLFVNGNYLVVIYSIDNNTNFVVYNTSSGNRIGGGTIENLNQVYITDIQKLNDTQFLVCLYSSDSAYPSEVRFYEIVNGSIYKYNVTLFNSYIPYACVIDNYSNLWGLIKDQNANIILGGEFYLSNVNVKRIIFSNANTQNFKAIPDPSVDSIFKKSILYNYRQNKVMYLGINETNNFYSILSFDPR